MIEITWRVEEGSAPHTFEIDPAKLVGMDAETVRDYVIDQADELMMETLFPTVTHGLDAAIACAARMAAA